MDKRKDARALEPLEDLTTKLEKLKSHHSREPLLFTVVNKESYGSARLNGDLLPGTLPKTLGRSRL